MSKFLASLLFVMFFAILITMGKQLYDREIKPYFIFKDFCEARDDFCYCSFGECEFKTSSYTKYTNGVLIDSGMSNDTLELCKLAERLEEKEVLFKVGCANE